jgi:[NiFe] hydrogenase assembly HybE family chaperone
MHLAALRRGETGRWSVHGGLLMSKPVWYDSAQIHRELEAVFNAVLTQRMQDSPLVNGSLAVQAVGFRTYRNHWIGILITPWFMNLLALPGEKSEWDIKQPGGKMHLHFPQGEFEFTVCTANELGRYAVCSLFSPMFQFELQAVAVTTAEAALQALLADAAPRHGISRRDWLRGAFGSEKTRV